MHFKQKEILVLVLLIVALLVLNYDWLDNVLTDFLEDSDKAHIDRIIDGDTIESNGTSIRLLGINAPERGEYFYEEARKFLEDSILNQTANLKYGKEKYDKYHRILAYVFLNGKNINIELVENGYANYYFYDGKDEYSDALFGAWETCMENKINLCESSTSVCSSCIYVYINRVINNCGFSCDLNGWEIKTEGREKFVFNSTLVPGGEVGFSLDLSNSGGGLFLRDEEGKLVGWNIAL